MLPDGDSVFTSPERVPVAVGSDDILAAMRAHNAARVVLEGTAADDEALAAFEQTLADHGDALASGGDEAAVNATIESLRSLIAVRETADASAPRSDLTLAEKIAADAAYLARRTAVRGTGGEDYTRIAARRDSLTRVASSGDSLTKLFVCARLSGAYCAESELASPLPAGSAAHLTVWYVGTRPFTVRWFREGEEVAYRTRNANQRVTTGYRVTFEQDVGQAGEWEARVYNSSGSFIGRKAFTVR
jgi:hypothetical protein